MTGPVLSAAELEGGGLGAALAGRGLVPVNTVAPSLVAGAATVGGKVLISQGRWTNNPSSFSVQIKRAGVAVGSPITTSLLYVPVPYTFVTADQGQVMTADVVAMSGNYASPAISVALGTPSVAGLFPTSIGPANRNDFTTWAPSGSVVTANTTVAPDGTTTASRALMNTAAGGHSVGGFTATTLANGFYRFEVIAKIAAGTLNLGFLIDNGSSTHRSIFIFNLITGAMYAGPSVSGTLVTPAGSFMQALGGGYYRCVAIVKNAGTSTLRLSMNAFSGGNSSFTGDGTSGFDLWRGQAMKVEALETGALSGISPIPVIVSTDLYTDIDDALALKMLANAAVAKEITLLAALTDSEDTRVGPAMKAMLEYSGLSAVPVGVYKGSEQGMSTTGSPFDSLITAAFRPNETKADYPNPVPVMRRALAAASNKSVVLLGIGSKVNFRDLLMSPADEFSNLTGIDLWALKVRRFVDMGGDYPSGTETNFQRLATATKYVYDNCPSEIIAVGFTDGTALLTTYPLDGNPVTDPYAMAWNNPPPAYTEVRSGMISLSIGAAGSGGVDGTYDIAATGGGGTGAYARVRVSAGVVVSARVIAPGDNYTSNPTISLASIQGLTGATVTAAFGNYNARNSWDPLATLVAIQGVDFVNVEPATPPCYNVVDGATGANALVLAEPGNGNVTYVRVRTGNTKPLVASVIDRRAL